jgi:hypothetical protein
MGSTETDYREGGNYLLDRTPAYLPDRYDKVVLLQDGLDDHYIQMQLHLLCRPIT